VSAFFGVTGMAAIFAAATVPIVNRLASFGADIFGREKLMHTMPLADGLICGIDRAVRRIR
jgi:hypothetical protein